MASIPVQNTPNTLSSSSNYYGIGDELKTENYDDLSVNNMDGKRMRKAVFRRTIDYNASLAYYLEQCTWRPRYSRRPAIQPDIMYQHMLTPPMDYYDNPMNCVCTKHVRTSTNKNKCPIYVVCWTPDGRRLITGASSGEFTLWNGLTFNFETILQAHDTHIRTMKWSHNEEWLLSADDSGMVKYWQANMNDVNVFQAHKDSVRGVSFSPSDDKFATCSNDNTVRVFDFKNYQEERVLRGHGGEVRCVSWHPTKSLLISGSKDSQQPIKLWDPKTGQVISTMYVHKSTVTDIAINENGNWFLSASKDHYIKLFDLRNLRTELQVFRGHKKDVVRVAWHPQHESLFASGGGDGALMYWLANGGGSGTNLHGDFGSGAGDSTEVGAVEDAHENIIWSLDWHPLGHILASGSNDFATKFWTRNRPGDVLRDVLGGAAINTATVTTAATLDDASAAALAPVDDDHGADMTRLIEAELEVSEKIEIPGLLESGADHHRISVSEDNEDIINPDNKDSHDNVDCAEASDKDKKTAAGSSASSSSRTVPRQFANLWSNPHSRSLAVQDANPGLKLASDPSGGGGTILVKPLMAPDSLPPQLMAPVVPPAVVTPLMQLTTATLPSSTTAAAAAASQQAPTPQMQQHDETKQEMEYMLSGDVCNPGLDDPMMMAAAAAEEQRRRQFEGVVPMGISNRPIFRGRPPMRPAAPSGPPPSAPQQQQRMLLGAERPPFRSAPSHPIQQSQQQSDFDDEYPPPPFDPHRDSDFQQQQFPPQPVRHRMPPPPHMQQQGMRRMPPPPFAGGPPSRFQGGGDYQQHGGGRFPPPPHQEEQYYEEEEQQEGDYYEGGEEEDQYYDEEGGEEEDEYYDDCSQSEMIDSGYGGLHHHHPPPPHLAPHPRHHNPHQFRPPPHLRHHHPHQRPPHPFGPRPGFMGHPRGHRPEFMRGGGPMRPRMRPPMHRPPHYDDNLGENPFEPQKSTGAARTFISLSGFNDDIKPPVGGGGPSQSGNFPGPPSKRGRMMQPFHRPLRRGGRH